VKLIGFDENDITLQAIKDGTCTGTVVQNPYDYGYQSVRVLTELLRGSKSAIPESKYLDIPPRPITKDNVDEFWADLKAKKGQ
jgi:ribose transport system substrate-binding protein